MDPAEEEDRKRKVAEAAQKQLSEGTWPQVMAVFGYRTPKAPRHTDEDFARIQENFGRAGCANMAVFAGLVRFDERRKGMPMSFNLSMRRRVVPGNAAPDSESAALLFSCPDILVGTRGGKDAAFEWFGNFIEALPETVPESMQIFDKVFGEAVQHMKQAGEETTIGGMLERAMTPLHERGGRPLKGGLPN